MFQKIHHKLAAICCLCTTGIVLLIILICLVLSEKNMYRAEEASFLMKANAISYDLTSSDTIDISLYTRNSRKDQDFLYIETDGTPSSFSTLLLSDEEKILIDEIKKYMHDSKLSQNSFKYQGGEHSYLVMSSTIVRKTVPVSYLYLHSLDSFQNQVARQRIYYAFILLISIALLYVFSFYFTAHALKPLIANQEKQKQFIALASHELRSPLAVFKTGLSILRGSPAPATADRFYNIMDIEIKRMELLVSDLLFLSKAEQSSLSYHFASADLSALLNAVYQKYLPLAAQKRIHLKTDISPAQKYCSVCDSQRIEQVIIIFLDNAFTYTPPGGTVTLGIQNIRSRNVIYVSDTGSGISDEEKKKIFDKFYQANPSHNNKEHFGLGLSIAKEICRAHRADITVKDTPGGGSTFSISIAGEKNRKKSLI